mmetsp:Transcript_13662/g.20796  ORF Transcript_13662/g.20796 Transcript_13662/m.20796 type:complete len:281 (+) Transcript_13662:52-894(+)
MTEEKTDLLNLSSLASALDKSTKDGAIVYSDEELEAMRKVKRRLEEEDGLTHINLRFLAYTVIACKNRVDDSVSKYRKFLKAISVCGDGSLTNVETDDDMWKDPNVESFLRDFYEPCGVDNEGRQILWINGGDKPITEDMEITSVRAGILFTAAIHSDSKSLREGITFVIDTSKQGNKKKIGNESKMQKLNQSYPLRPQSIYIAGSSYATRIVINGLIKVASLFTKQKILQRLKFVTMEEAVSLVPRESAPKYVGGKAGGIDDVVEWTKKRYASLPVPDI